MSEQGRKTVLVLGAGFTKAFFPKAPLVEDYYDLGEVKQKVQSLAHAQKILNAELAACGNEQREGKDKVNMERLMTRLHGGMPYDRDMDAEGQLRIPRVCLQQVLTGAIAFANPEHEIPAPFLDCAAGVLRSHADCITFNYDDFLDHALYERSVGPVYPERHCWWDPKGGYGFHCRGLSEGGVESRCSTRLLKLHGSLNWRVIRGASSPYPVDCYRHCSQWHPSASGFFGGHGALLELGLEPQPFVVPPVLTKGELLREPLLELLWSEAFRALARARLVIFVGYSFPPSDFAARFLFTEAIPDGCEIRVVNYAAEGDEQQKERLKAAYRQVFPGLEDEQFDFAGAENSPIWDDL